MNWLLYKLAPDNGIQGCHINFPETILFANCKVARVIRQSEQGYLYIARHGMSDIELRSHLISISTERTKENQRRL